MNQFLRRHTLLAGSAAFLAGIITACALQNSNVIVQPTPIVATATAVLAQPTAMVAQPTTAGIPPTATVMPTIPPVATITLPTTTSIPPTAVPPTVVAPTPFDAQPATEPLDAVQRFLSAAQADRSGRLAANYAGDGLRTALEQGSVDIGMVMQEQNPFTGFILEGVIDNPPPFVYVQVVLSYGQPPQTAATRIFTVKQEGDFWLVTGVSVFANDDPARSPEQQVREATARFLDLLNTGRYQEAGAFFGGDMQPLLAQNPDLTGDAINDPVLRGQLLERACTVNGYSCRQQRRIIAAQQIDNDEYLVAVEFNNPDGSLYQHPVDGRSAFEIRVQQINGQWMVMDLLPYTA
jgi:hypothetical protein